MSTLKIMIVVAVLMVSSFAQAQKLNWFEAEGAVYYELSGCTPGSDVNFYSETGGGKMLKKIQADKTGNVLIKDDLKFHPASVLNSKHGSSRKIAGTGKLLFVGEKDFSFKDAALEQRYGKVNLTWSAAINSEEPVMFEVLRSNDAINYTVAGKLLGTRSSASTPYSFVEQDAHPALCYKIGIVEGGKLRYTTGVFSVENKLQVFPSATTSSLTVVLPASFKVADYVLVSESGQMVQKGVMNQTENTLSVQDIAPGNYLVIVTGGGANAIGRFVKL